MCSSVSSTRHSDFIISSSSSYSIVHFYMTVQDDAKDILSAEQAEVLYCDKAPMCSGQANVCPASSNRFYGKFPEMMTGRHEQRITMHSRISVSSGLLSIFIICVSAVPTLGLHLLSLPEGCLSGFELHLSSQKHFRA
jgi:hypothetical protein